jgi:hypothetical protein
MELIDRAKTTFEYLRRDETEMKSKEPGGELLAVDFCQPRKLVMLWFELNFGTNPPLGILMI